MSPDRAGRENGNVIHHEILRGVALPPDGRHQHGGDQLRLVAVRDPFAEVTIEPAPPWLSG